MSQKARDSSNEALAALDRFERQAQAWEGTWPDYVASMRADLATIRTALTSGGTPESKRDALRTASPTLVEPEWRPIESAPMDGTRVVITGTNGIEEWIAVAEFDAERGHWWSDFKEWRILPPTHWMPLPPLPAAPTTPKHDKEPNEK